MDADGANLIDSGNPLLRAVFLRRLRLTRLLLEGGAYINESDGHGQTPLMVACRTQHVDAQSASRVKLVQFLLEKGADPNIQDKDGRSAVMHACREQAGADVVSLLLAFGADISLQDRTSNSALVYAVMAGDLPVLKLLLDTCKANGKEVIIIATEQFPCGKVKAEQFLSVPTFSPVVHTDKSAPLSPASPSDVQLSTSSTSLFPPKPMFSFKEEEQICGISSHPSSPFRLRGLGQTPAKTNGLQQPLLRLNSEPWLKIPPSLFASDKTKNLNPEENLSFLHPLELEEERWSAERETKDEDDGTKQKISLPGLTSSHSASHPNLHSSTPPHLTEVSSSLQSIIQRRKLGSDIYGSDPLLAANARAKDPTNGRKLSPLRSSGLTGFERRGSSAFLLDPNSQSRPRSLPPLTFNSIPNYGMGKEFLGKSFLPSAPPGQPKEATRKTLLRRHSMQSERLKAAT